jgi:glycosyltransferase involved in cell wall biosynthesis
VLHLVHWLNRGGIEKWLLDFTTAVGRDAVEMDVCCKGPSTGALVSEFQKVGARVLHIPLGWNHRAFGRRLRRALIDGRYDLLHIQAGAFAGYPARVARSAGVGVVTTFHSTVFRAERNATAGPPAPSANSRTSAGRLLSKLRAIPRQHYAARSVREACTRSHVAIAVSASVRDSIASMIGPAAARNFRILPCGTVKRPGRDASVRDATREKLGFRSNAPVAIHVGTMREAKNHEGLLRIAAEIRESLPEVQLLITGDGPLRGAIERQARVQQLNDAVRFLGARDDVEALLESADLMLFPSRWEGLPVAVVEAQMKGLPVIGTDIGPMREATIPGETSLLFPLEQEHGMAAAAIALLNDEPRRQRMGVAAMQFAAARFSMDAIAGEHLRIYRDVARQNERADHQRAG